MKLKFLVLLQTSNEEVNATKKSTTKKQVYETYNQHSTAKHSGIQPHKTEVQEPVGTDPKTTNNIHRIKQTLNMEAPRETRRMNTFTFRVPAGSQSAFLRTMAKNMGWEAVPQPRKSTTITRTKKETRYPALDRAIEDVKAGRVTEYSSAEEMFKKLGI